MTAASTTTACRSCGQVTLTTLLDLGRTPLANSLLTPEQLANQRNDPEETFPLDLAFCSNCTLVQITETVPPEKLFSEYLYFSSFSETMLDHARDVTAGLMATRKLGPDSLVVEVASNDGYLLQYYQEAGIPVLGIEPARNVAFDAIVKRRILTLVEFFGLELAERLRARDTLADVIHGHNVMAHVADLNGFVGGLARLLKPGGMAIIEAPYVKDMIDGCEFDTIYHEHLCYFSLTAVEKLARRHGLMVQDVTHVKIHGGTLRYQLALVTNPVPPSDRVRDLLAEEAAWGVSDLAFYRGFAAQVEALGASLKSLLGSLRKDGKHVAAYGAAAKGSTLLNFFGLGSETLEYVVDRSTYKQGRYMPGVHLPIYAPEHLLETQPDYVLLLTWNFAEEIMRQQAEYARRGGKFVLPVPQPQVVSA